MINAPKSNRMKEITPIPARTNIIAGYCPNCGLVVYDTDVIQYWPSGKVYRCIHCKQEINESELIPF
jgi:hypothetical protein